MRVLALASADWHISDHVRSHIPLELKNDVDILIDLIWREVERLCPRCFILAGDIFDTKAVNGESLSKCARFVYQCENAGCAVLFVQGQHDLNKVPILSSIGRAFHLNGILSSYVVENIWIGGLDFSYKPLSPISCDVLVTHQNWKRPNWPFGIQDPLPALAKKKLVISGDWHEHVVFDLGDDLPKILSPGAITPQRLSEPKTCSIWAIYDDLSYSSIRIPSRKWFDFTIRDADALDEAISEVNSFNPSQDTPDQLSTPACILRYPAELHSTVLKAVSTMHAVCIHVLLQDKKEDQHIDRTMSGCFDIKQVITRMYSGDPRLKDIESVLSASSPSEIRSIVQNILGENGAKISKELG